MAQPTDNPTVHHEESDVNIRAIFGFGAGLIAVALAIHLLMWLLFLYFGSRHAGETGPEFPIAAEMSERLPPEPRLQTRPREDLATLRTQEAILLGGYSWVDRSSGVVRIPLDEAVRLVLERGLPARADRKREK